MNDFSRNECPAESALALNAGSWGRSANRSLIAILCCLLIGCGGGGPGGGAKRKGLSRPQDPDPRPAAPPAAPVINQAAKPAKARPGRAAAGGAVTLPEGQTGVQLEGGSSGPISPFFLRRFPGAEGQPTRIVLTSARHSEAMEFPAIFFQAELSADEAQELVGHSVKGRLFYQPSAEGPVFHSPAAGVEVQFNTMTEESVEGEIFESQLTSSEGTRRIPLSGAFVAGTRESIKRRVRQPAQKAEEF
ncbi:MAG: hypothetical protein NT069_14245 [Planctomycetota bacterium]|nr:hypothetical protein [Planctomycetota bacterium]